MRLAPWMLSAASMGVAIVLAFVVLTGPTTINQQSTPADIERALANLKPHEEKFDVPSPQGGLFHCAVADSTGDPVATDYTWYVEWCAQTD